MRKIVLTFNLNYQIIDYVLKHYTLVRQSRIFELHFMYRIVKLNFRVQEMAVVATTNEQFFILPEFT